MPFYKVYLNSAEINCKPNNVLLSRLFLYLRNNNHAIVSNLDDADYIIISTCGFDEFHEKRSLKLFKSHKNKYNAKIISLGCLNKINRELISQISPEILIIPKLSELDKIFYNNLKFNDITEAYINENINKHLKITEEYQKDQKKIFFMDWQWLRKRSKLYNDINNELCRQNKFYVEICKGCIGNCSYCIIKKARGKIESRQIPHIISDIDKVYNPGQHLCFVADDCGSYGVDTKSSFPILVKEVHNRYPYLGIDICYLNPYWLVNHEKEYLALFRNHNITSINISVQSGSNSVIKKMDRHYDINKVKNTINKIRKISPKTFIWTHILVGFPGETWSDYFKTLAMVHRFDMATVFSYSDRKGTKSAGFQNKNSKLAVFMKKQFARTLVRLNVLAKITGELFSRNSKH